MQMQNYFLRHPFVAKSLRMVAMFGSALLLIILYVALIGVSIDLAKWRGKAAALLTQNLGREVRFEGPLQLEISAHPKLKIGGLHIANANGFEGGDFASLGEARLALDLWPLLRMRFQVEELSGSDVHARLQVKKDGTNNWKFNPPKPKQETTPKMQAASVDLAMLLAAVDIKRVSLEKLNVEFIGANQKSHFFELQSLVAKFPAGEPISLALNGTVEKNAPYQLHFTGGTVADLAHLEKPWPVDLKLDFMSSHLTLNGSLSESSGSISFGLGTENLSEFEQLLQIKLPAVGVAGIAGKIKYEPNKIALENLSGVMGKTILSGELNFNTSGERPKLQGELNLPVLDLRPFITDKPVTKEEPPKSFAEVYHEISAATFSLKELNSADADLTLRVGQWLSLPGDVRDAKLQVKLERGRLKVPVQATVADVLLSGSASVDASVASPEFALALGTHNSNLGNLASVLFGVPGVKGHLGRFDLRIAARGDRGAELMQSLDVRFDVERGKLSYGNGEGERPVQFSLDRFALALPAGKKLTGDVAGSLLDKAFSAKLRGSSLAELTGEAAAPIDFELQAGTARAEIHAVVQGARDKPETNISFELAAPHSGEIATWLGLKLGADAPINMSGKFQAESKTWHLSDFTLKLGHSDFSVDLLRTVEKGKSLIKLSFNSFLIDAEQLQSLLPESKEKAPVAQPAAVNMIDIPILPSGISLADADIAVRLKRISSSSPVKVGEIRFDGHIRDGMMYASPFSANVAESDFSGAIMLDLRTQQPHATLWLAAGELNIGSVLQQLSIANDLDTGIDFVRLQLDLHSSRLGQLLEQSELVLSFEGGYLLLKDANTKGTMRIALDSGELKSAPSAPVYLDLLGSFDTVPISIAIQTAKAADLIRPNLSIPFKLNVSTSGAAIQLTGDVDRPFSNKDIELALDMSAVRLDNLSALAHTALPPWGPVMASGKFHMSSAGYELKSLLVQVGSSQLNGFGKMDTKAVPPRIDVALTAPSIQLDDFKTDEVAVVAKKPAVTEKTKSKVDARQQAREASLKTQKMLSPEILKRQNAFVQVRVDQVMSGEDVLGNGKLDAQLKDGRADVSALVNTLGGAASVAMGYEPSEKDVAINLRVEAKNFDYGVLARRFDKKSEMSGVFSLDVNVSSRTPYLSDTFVYGKGYVDFAVWPQNLKSGLLDVWAVNVLMALLPAIDSSNESKVNCAIGRFALADGMLVDKGIVIDTSRMRVTGTGGVDFKNEKINLYVKPKAKTPQFLSLAIPIELSGSFDDFSVGVRTSDVVGSVGQLVTSVIWVPLQMMFGKTIPADGKDVCQAGSLKGQL